MNTRFKDIFRGKVVNKRLTVNTGVDEFPRFVVEYLIDNYCTEENFHEDIQQVVKRLRENFVHGAEAEKIRHQIRETRNHSIIANLEVRLQETEDKYWGTLSAINESFVNVTESLVRQYPMLLSGGMWGTITLTYDETEVHNKKIRPFKVTEFTPFQISVIDLNEFIDKRRQFEADEWLDIIVNSIGLNPEQLSRREKLLYLMRLVPMVEANCNTIELAPRETGKTYIYRNVSYYTTVLSGGKATPASLFINNATGKVGVVGSRDVVVFDEIANTDFTDPKALVSIMQVTDDQLAELLLVAIEGRQRVRHQLHLMAPGEYGPLVLAGKMAGSGKMVAPTLPDAQRLQKVTLPSSPQVGEVVGLAVLGEDRGCLLHFEMQATRGSGRIVSLGSMQKVMKESVAAAAQFIKTHAKDIGLPGDWQNNFDIAVLATMMGIPKEGPSAGITIVTGIVSALTGRPVRNDIAMTGEITIMGKVLAIGGVLPKLQAAIDAGCKEVIMPQENERDVQMTPDYVRRKINVRFVSSIEEVLEAALLKAAAV